MIRKKNRSLWRRAFAAVLAPWCAVVMAEPAALHTCAMHAGHAVAAHSMAGHMGHDVDHGSAHEMGAPATDHAPAAPEHSAAHCTCLGGCCAASAVAAPTAAELAWVPVELRRTESPIADEHAPAASAEHVLPFANGPPARV